MMTDLRELVGLLFISVVIVLCGLAGIVWFTYDFLKDLKEPK